MAEKIYERNIGAKMQAESIIYHRAVYEKVSPYLNEEEKEWLKKYTREI